MTRKEFCEIMAAGHEEAAKSLRISAKRAKKSGLLEHWLKLPPLVAQEEALARAFRDLAKEQE